MALKYLKIGNDAEGLNNFHTKELETLAHQIYEGDFMGMCKHDIACHVCFNNPAIICKDVSINNKPAHKKWSVQPCHSCQEKGFMTVKMPKILRRFLK